MNIAEAMAIALRKASGGDGRPERILAELRSQHPEVLDRVALSDVAVIAGAAEVVTLLDIGDLMATEL